MLGFEGVTKRGRVAEWLGTGLQNPLLRFNSGRDLRELPRWRNGILRGLKILGLQNRVGSSPTRGTKNPTKVVGFIFSQVWQESWEFF